MVLTDTHTHLYSESFDDDRGEMMERALKKGIGRFFVPAIDSSYTPAMKDLKSRYPKQVHLMTGLHPTHVKEDFEAELAHVEEELQTGEYIAVGEIGMDLYWDQTFVREQEEAFLRQMAWAEEKDLPIVIHCREAFDEIFAVLESTGRTNFKGIFHCFTGNKEQAQQLIDWGFYLGIGGVVTFKNGKIDQFLNELPLETLVLETDSPYLAPVPYRGKRNESAYLEEVAQKVASLFDTSVERIAEVTTQNSQKIFGI
jgi:TatD DNase family protein